MAPSAYPLAFPGAFASGPILPFDVMRRTDYSRRRDVEGLLRSQSSFDAAGRTALFAGVVRVNRDACRQDVPLTRVHFGPSLSTCVGWFWLTTIQSCFHINCPFAAVLDGVPSQVLSYRLLSHAPLFEGCHVSKSGTRCHGVHLPGGNCTHTMKELSGTIVPAVDTRLAAVVNQRITRRRASRRPTRPLRCRRPLWAPPGSRLRSAATETD